MPKKQTLRGFFVLLPPATIREIKRRSRLTKPKTAQWRVVVKAIRNSQPAKARAKR